LVVASGASCPDTLVDQVVGKILSLKNVDITLAEALKNWMQA
jgi:4-hydroxy-3-methylbut-2-enyl diphosphate reductase IspH